MGGELRRRGELDIVSGSPGSFLVGVERGSSRGGGSPADGSLQDEQVGREVALERSLGTCERRNQALTMR